MGPRRDRRGARPMRSNPQTAYARSKIATEQSLKQMELGGMRAVLPAFRHRLRLVRRGCGLISC